MNRHHPAYDPQLAQRVRAENRDNPERLEKIIAVNDRSTDGYAVVAVYTRSERPIKTVRSIDEAEQIAADYGVRFEDQTDE